jgi:hypothetical protein
MLNFSSKLAETSSPAEVINIMKNLLVKLQLRKRSEAELASCNESQTLKAQRIKVC